MFNLANQKNLDSSIKNLIESGEAKIYKQEKKKRKNKRISTNPFEACKKSIDYIKQIKHLNKCKLNKEEEELIECCNYYLNILENKKDEANTEDESVFVNLGDLFDFIIKRENVKNIFKEKINEIIHIMESIIYTPPYNILFGRIKIDKPKPITNEYPYRKDINKLFYEGFGIEI